MVRCYALSPVQGARELARAYPAGAAYPHLNVVFVEVDKFDGPGSSLGYSLLQAEPQLQCPFFFFCCDSVVNDDVQPTPPHNALFVAPSPDSTSYASVNTAGGRVVRVNNKGEANFDYVYTGVSYIHGTAHRLASLVRISPGGSP